MDGLVGVSGVVDDGHLKVEEWEHDERASNLLEIWMEVVNVKHCHTKQFL